MAAKAQVQGSVGPGQPFPCLSESWGIGGSQGWVRRAAQRPEEV